jgi:hypothetical protein
VADVGGWGWGWDRRGGASRCRQEVGGGRHTWKQRCCGKAGGRDRALISSSSVVWASLFCSSGSCSSSCVDGLCTTAVMLPACRPGAAGLVGKLLGGQDSRGALGGNQAHCSSCGCHSTEAGLAWSPAVQRFSTQAVVTVVASGGSHFVCVRPQQSVAQVQPAARLHLRQLVGGPTFMYSRHSGCTGLAGDTCVGCFD